jgi:hypothetical protein
MSAGLQRRLERVEAERGKVGSDVRSVIQAKTQRPRRTREVLERIARQDDMAGRMARGDLRIGRIGNSTAAIADPERELAQQAVEFWSAPLEFVLWAFEWDCDPTLQLVALPAPWDSIYDCEHGPDRWACDLLDEMGRQERERAFDGKTAVAPIRLAVSSGHGIGKSALTAWVILWLMLRPGARGVATANTSQQLQSRTWAELQKWLKRSIFADWFEITTGAQMRMYQRDNPESWAIHGQTCREENAEAFAGIHAASSTAFMVFDEASAIPSKIWETASGALTDGSPVWLACGNPTRNTGSFYEAFNGQRHLWTTRQIDSRSVQITNKQLLDEWVETYGETSDFVSVRVRGVFPSASSLQLIGRDLVEAAMRREVAEQKHEAVVVGVDVARFGDDESVIFTRRGLDGRSWEVKRFRNLDLMQLSSRVAEHVVFFRSLGLPTTVFVDATGIGSGVEDRLRQLGINVVGVQFSSKADDARKHANRRAMMWDRMKDWLAIGALPKDDDLVADLTGVEYFYDRSDRIQLEAKEDMKRRGLSSPDIGDALALTFAQAVLGEMPGDFNALDASKARRAYNPFDAAFGTTGKAQTYDPFAGAPA